MKITMYELLGMVKDGKTPKIKFNNSIYEYHDKEHGYCRYYHDNTYICLDTDYYLFDILNDEVEILEEEPRDIEVCGTWITKSEYDKLAHSEEEKKIPERVLNAKVFDVPKLNNRELSNIALTNKEDIKIIKDTLNKVLDYLKSKGE